MKLASCLLLLAGWCIVLSAIVFFPLGPMRSIFVLAGIGLEALGISLSIRAHLLAKEERE